MMLMFATSHVHGLLSVLITVMFAIVGAYCDWHIPYNVMLVYVICLCLFVINDCVVAEKKKHDRKPF